MREEQKKTLYSQLLSGYSILRGYDRYGFKYLHCEREGECVITRQLGKRDTNKIYKCLIHAWLW